MARRRRKNSFWDNVFGPDRGRAVKSPSARRKRTVNVEIKDSVLREIWAVVHLSFGVFTVLSLQENFGLVGDIWMGIVSPILGWGVYLLPVIFFGSAFMLFFSKKLRFHFSRVVGMGFLVVSILSILHLYVPMESLFSQAKEGSHGGYVGFVMNFIFRELLSVGHAGAITIFIMLLLIGILLTFEISLGALISFLKPEINIVRKKTREVSEEVEEPVQEVYEEQDYSEEEFERERVNMKDHENEMITIRRPVPIKQNDEAVVSKTIHIVDGGVTGEGSEYENYVWEAPPLDILHPAVPDIALDDNLLHENAKKIKNKLKQFGIDVEMNEIHVGPTVVQYTLKPSEGIKLSKITVLKNDLALALAAKAIRIEAPIPGKSLMGIEVPNDQRSIVHLREVLESDEFEEIASNLKLPLGRDVSGKPVCDDLGDMPHVLIAGATGSGKSVGMNAFLLSLLYQNSPADLKLILIDPKRVELTSYNGIPHLLTPVVTDPEKAAIALRWGVAEMNRRYQLFSENRVKNITEYNELVAQKNADVKEENVLQKLPKIVIVIDELADLMMAAGKEVEASICRVAQMARAVGLHLIVATQRPSVDVITGLIKANIPARIAFAVSSQVDSRTIIDGIGAEDLLGKGDMLYLPGGMSKPFRVQGIFVSSKEIERVTNHLKLTTPPNYCDDIISPRTASQKVQGVPQSQFSYDGSDDDLYEQALQVVLETRKASASLLQRRLKLGYARAARLLDLMEENGVIGPVNGSKAREIYMD